MKLRIETVALIIGLIGSGFSFALVSWWGAFPIDVREFFRGGNFGGQVIGVFAIIGLVGFLIMLFNLLTGERKLWWFRLSGYISFLYFTISFGLAE
jgi:hypothetical protein